jgi:hypothetical protein
MNRKWLLLAGAADLFILSLLDKIAFRYYFYWRYAWFDVPMHLIGGLAIGLVSAWAYLEAKSVPERRAGDLVWFCLLFSAAIGLTWELFELFFDRMVVFSWFDSAKDMSLGAGASILTGLIVGYLAIWRKKTTREN